MENKRSADLSESMRSLASGKRVGTVSGDHKLDKPCSSGKTRARGKKKNKGRERS